MPGWTQVDWDELNEPRTEEISGVEVTVFFSPYDMPEAVRGKYDEDDARFVVEFKYIGGKERLKFEKQDDCITLGVGRTSNRLYKILIDVEESDIKQVKVEVGQFASKMADKLLAYSRTHMPSSSGVTEFPSSNYEAVSQVIQRHPERVFGDLQGVFRV